MDKGLSITLVVRIVLVGMFSLGRVGSRLGEFCKEKKKKYFTTTLAQGNLVSPGRKLEVLTRMVLQGRAGSHLSKN